MPAITYQDWSGGLDRRLSINSQDANKLWVLKNAYVTQGKKIKKRPALRALPGSFSVDEDGRGYKGLFAINGELRSYKQVDISATLPDGVIGKDLSLPISDNLLTVPYSVVFQGYEYVISTWEQPGGYLIKNYYLNGVGTEKITDPNCPQAWSATVAASRIFEIGGENVRFCAAGVATDWTSASDAGFLAAGLQQNTTAQTTAVGTFQDALVVFFDENAQIWDVKTDPSLNSIRKLIKGVGTRAPFSLADFANDLVFLSPFGFKSMRVSSTTDRIDDNDIGSPVDKLVVADVAASTDPLSVFAIWIPQFGQYWAVFDMGDYSKAWVYTYSRQSKISCWSEYVFPIVITAVCTNAGKVYVRSATKLYEVVEEQYTDDGELVDVEVQMAFQDAKSPGVDKQFYGADYIVQGSPTVAFKFDPRDESKETTGITIPGDTRPGQVLPVEIVAPAIAPVFRHSLDEAFELEASTFYYHLLSVGN
jgi:hypothetical protein